MGRAPCCDKSSVKKGPWSPEEDAKLKSFIHQNGTGGNWIALPQKIGLKRCGKSCRLRWLNYLRPNIKHGGFSDEEDNIICSLYISIGSRWSIIAAQLPGRTDNDIKNYWNTRLKKKLLGKHRKEKRGRGRSANPQATEAVLPPPIPCSNGEPRFNDYASIRNLLIRFEEQIKPPAVDEALTQPLYNPIDQLNTTASFGGAYMNAVLPINSQGLDFFYDEFIGTSTAEIVTSSIFADQGFLQEEFCVDKMSYLGIQ